MYGMENTRSTSGGGAYGSVSLLAECIDLDAQNRIEEQRPPRYAVPVCHLGIIARRAWNCPKRFNCPECVGGCNALDDPGSLDDKIAMGLCVEPAGTI